MSSAASPVAQRRPAWPAPVRAVGLFLYPSAHLLLPFALLMAAALVSVAVLDYRKATEFADHGQTVNAVQAHVLVGEGGCRGGCAAILAVEAYVPSLGWVGPRGPYAQPDLPDATPRGWRDASPATGYEPPLRLLVIHRPGGVVDAMTVADVSRVRTSEQAHRWVGAALLVLGFAAGIGPYVRQVKKRRAARRG